jgi:glycosyltransferase involved in cell wall biosynthesis
MLLSTIVLTLNEIRNIERCLLSVCDLPGEILVVDHGSSDGTQKMAENLGARVVSHKLPDFSAARNFALKEAQGDYVFFLDADEVVSPKLASEILAFVESPQKKAMQMKRQNHAFGRKISFGPLSPDWVTRVFPKGELTWKGKVHERPIHSLPLGKFQGRLSHYTYHSFSEYLQKQERYARLWALDARAAGRTSTPFKALVRATLAFLKMFFLKMGILGGPVCWALCWYNSSGYTLGKYLLLADAKDAKPHKDTQQPKGEDPKKPIEESMDND